MLQWKPQRDRDAKDVKQLPREAVGSEHSHPEKMVLWAAASKDIGVKLPETLDAQKPLQCGPDARHEGFRLNVFSAEFWSLASSVLSILLFFLL
jgi:hypothetical protein